MLTAAEVLDRYFLELRCKLLEVAATLDRIDRAGGREMLADERRPAIDQALELLQSSEPNRAEQLQMLFSRPYDPNWFAASGLASASKSR